MPGQPSACYGHHHPAFSRQCDLLRRLEQALATTPCRLLPWSHHVLQGSGNMLQRAFFSFVDLTDQSRHAEYNDWHLYDHRPENLALPGVAWGDRWARLDRAGDDPDRAGTTTEEYAGVDYVAMYWFREPLEQSIAEWFKLGSDSVQWGRG